MKLSILIPSKRPEELKKFIQSVKDTAVDFESIEIVSLVDDKLEHIKFHGNLIEIHYNTQKPVNMGKLLEECYCISTGDWIMFCNDDTIVETPNWDAKLFNEINKYPDEIALFWPNDNMFKNMLSCFPIVSRKVLELINFFPIDYRRYKIDDTLFDIFPRVRHIYLDNIVFNHFKSDLMDEDSTGFQLPDGRFYPIDKESAEYDNLKWKENKTVREQQRFKIFKELNMSNNKVMICVPTAEFARRADFYDYFNALQKPEGTMATFTHGQSPAKNRNLMIRQALENNCTHVMFIDDDMALPPDALMRLLVHDKDMVSGLYLLRNYPHFPVMFDEWYPDGRCKYAFLTKGKNGLMRAVNAGFGCVLIKTEVFRAMKDPWVTLGAYEKDNWCDDIHFFNKAREAGFELYVDLDIKCGHIISAVIVPNMMEDGTWMTLYNTNSVECFQVPQIAPTIEEQKKVEEAQGIAGQGHGIS